MPAKNFLANYGGKLWGFISIYIFVPIYIHFLGIESYAIISVYTLVIAVISFIDSGFSSTIIKEFSSSSDNQYKKSLLLKIERIYFGCCFGIFIFVYFFSGFLAKNWLKVDNVPIDKLNLYIRLIGLGVPLQLLSSLYFGALIGLQKHVIANYYQIAWNIAKSAGVILLFYIFKPSLTLFFSWQIACVIIYILLLRRVSLKYINTLFFTSLPKDFILRKSVIKYLLAVTVMSVISSVNSQADKLITSSYLSLKQFGLYSIASTIAQIPLLISTPFAITVFPTLSFNSLNKAKNIFSTSFINFSLLLNPIIFSIGIYLFFYSGVLLQVWMGTKKFSPDELADIICVGRYLVVGSCFLALQLLPFYTLLSKSETKYSIYQGLFQTLIGLPLMYFMIRRYGYIGIGIPYILINLLGLIYIYRIISKKHLSYNITSAIFKSIFIPLVVPLMLCFATSLLFPFLVLYVKLVVIMLSGIFSLIITYLIILDKPIIKSIMR